jgi:hypothetical protein
MVLDERIDASSAMFALAEKMKEMGYPPEEICREVRTVAQEVVAGFAGRGA